MTKTREVGMHPRQNCETTAQHHSAKLLEAQLFLQEEEMIAALGRTELFLADALVHNLGH
jgi:hypothetical protein